MCDQCEHEAGTKGRSEKHVKRRHRGGGGTNHQAWEWEKKGKLQGGKFFQDI